MEHKYSEELINIHFSEPKNISEYVHGLVQNNGHYG